MKRHALFIGIDRYEDSQISSLGCAESDAVHLHGFFTQRLGYEEVQFLLSPSADQILDTVARLIAPLGPDDLFVFFFAGHGIRHERRDLLLSAKARHARLKHLQQVIPVDLLLEETARPGLHRVFVLDACRSNLLRDRQAGTDGFAGLAATRDIVASIADTTLAATGSLAVICSCEHGGQAGEIPEQRGGVFRLALQSVLDLAVREGRPAAPGDELIAAVASEMDRLAQQYSLPRRQRPSREMMVGTPSVFFTGKAAAPPPVTPSQPDAAALYQRGKAAYFGRGVPQDHVSAVRFYRMAAELGSAGAQVHLGFCYANGDGVPQDRAEGVRWTRMAAEQGIALVQAMLGEIYLEGDGVAKDEAKALYWYRRAAEQGFIGGQFGVGLCYADGHGVAKDEAEAYRWYRKAAEQGVSEAQKYADFLDPEPEQRALITGAVALSQIAVGTCFAKGQGVAKDKAEYVRWYRKAAELGFAQAQLGLAWCYENGCGVAKDETEAVRWYRLAAAQGSADAQFGLGCCLFSGRGVPKDDSEGVRWVFTAAEQGHADAQASLGYSYEVGQGVLVDAAEAVRWYRKAAEQGVAVAQLNLGRCLYFGNGVSKDDAESVGWCRKAAEQGNAEAQFTLGASYTNGQGVPKDKVEAERWYRMAAEQGYPGAQDRLAALQRGGIAGWLQLFGFR